jgi:hypothetical protein
LEVGAGIVADRQPRLSAVGISVLPALARQPKAEGGEDVNLSINKRRLQAKQSIEAYEPKNISLEPVMNLKRIGKRFY